MGALWGFSLHQHNSGASTHRPPHSVAVRSHPRPPGPFSCSPSPIRPLSLCLFLTAGNSHGEKEVIRKPSSGWGVTSPVRCGLIHKVSPEAAGVPAWKERMSSGRPVSHWGRTLGSPPSNSLPAWTSKEKPLNPKWGLMTCSPLLDRPRN